MKNFVMAAALVLAAGSASAQLYSNFGGYNSGAIGLSTGALTGSGVAAPAGFEWSELQNDGAGNANTSAGFTASLAAPGPNFRLADDFVIPAGQTWNITSILTYGYQTGSAPTAQPITGGSINIWSGAPNAGGTIVATGTFATSTNTNLYRVFSTTTPAPGAAPGTTRLIREVAWSFSAVTLGEGTYWIDYQYVGAGTIFNPSITIPGTRGLTGWNALQLASGVWGPVIDAGNPATAADLAQDLPFVIIPSPGAFALLGMGGLLAARRRR